MRFSDRLHAGRHLAEAVRRVEMRGLDVVVVALPRGGVPVGFEVATALGVSLDVLVVRKLGVPFQPELAMGAIGEGGVRVENPEVLRSTGLGEKDLEEAERRERPELERRAALYREGRSRADVRGRCAIVVDDGIATGSSVRAACQVLRALGAARLVVAVPVASQTAVSDTGRECDQLICLEVPDPFFAVGEWYRDFSQTSDDEVVDLLRRSALDQEHDLGHGGMEPSVFQINKDVELACAGIELAGRLTIPLGATGVVLFAHGSGSSRHSPRNQRVAEVLQQAGLATLLLDLLTPSEELDASSVFDVGLLADRLGEATVWASQLPELASMPIGFFGASTGAAAALRAAAQPDCPVAAIVSRGGRPDLAAPALQAVTAPTLFIVGGRDRGVLEMNRKARTELRCESELFVVPGASHLFAEPGALDSVAGMARDWFVQRLVPEVM